MATLRRILSQEVERLRATSAVNGSQLPALAVPGLAVAMFGLTRSGGSLALVGAAAGMAHAVSMAVWLGGVVLLSRVVLAGPGEEDLVHAVRGFGRIATPARITVGAPLAATVLAITVREGDTCIRIAQRQLGSARGIEAIHRLNNLGYDAGPSASTLDDRAALHALVRAFLLEYERAGTRHVALVTATPYLAPDLRERILDRQRDVVSAVMRHLRRAYPERFTPRNQSALTMMLFGMINWTFTWLKPDGPLSYEAFAEEVIQLLEHGFSGSGSSA